MKKGFTLIELLVVVGILGILAVAALVAINPAEAQRKSRDATRLKDLTTLQTVFEQFINDTRGALPATWTTAPLTVVSTGSGGSTLCSLNWTGQNLCTYLQQVPRDPVNRSTRVLTTVAAGSFVQANAVYTLVRVAGGGYKLCARMESETNRNKLNNVTTTPTNPGAANATGVAVGSDMTVDCGY